MARQVTKSKRAPATRRDKLRAAIREVKKLMKVGEFFYIERNR